MVTDARRVGSCLHAGDLVAGEVLGVLAPFRFERF